MKKYFLFSIVAVLCLLTRTTDARIIEVSVISNAFAPTSFIAVVGDTIRWTLVEGSHNVVSTSVPTGAATWNYTFTGTGDTYSYIVTVDGVYEYECTFHPGMAASFSTKQNLPLVEDFNFPDGDSLSLHGWVVHSGTAATMIRATSPGLVFPNYDGSGIGNAALLNQNGIDMHRMFNFDTTSAGSVYTSFMLKVSSIASGYFFHLGRNWLPFNTFDFRARLFMSGTAPNLTLGLSFGTNTAVNSADTYAVDSTYLVVVKYRVVEGADNDEVSLYIIRSSDPYPWSEPATPTVGPLTASGIAEIFPGSIALRQYSANHNITIDGIRVGLSWSTVIPVELSSFKATAVNGSVNLAWTTATETNNSGFEIERQLGNGQWSNVAFVAGKGTTTEKTDYTYTDAPGVSGFYNYRLKQVDFDGSFEYSNTVSVNLRVPSNYVLSQNYPNPFNPSTKIEFSIPVTANVKISVYNALGEYVQTLMNSALEAGSHSVIFDATNLPGGVYLYSIESGDYKETKKMTLLK
ncbi:MAG: T9SS type A sorting domain-containing protein [Ignavibacteriaceae bacterium]|nr:T9SS type A sorting domain-containing protein [Ignavibacteriaceae bacterium]